ncbi:MAG: YncE family protein [Bdellovibrionales bacterium]
MKTSSLLSLLISLFLTGCFIAGDSLNQGSDTDANLVISSGEFSLKNSFNGYASSVSQPIFKGSVDSKYNGSTINVFEDSNCSTNIGSATVSSGEFSIENIVLDSSMPSYGIKNFYWNLTNPSGSSSCINPNISYTLFPKNTFSINEPNDFIFSADGKTMYLIDSFTDDIFAMNLEDKGVYLVTGAHKGNGTVMNGPVALTIDEENLVLYVYNTSTKSIFSVDIATGNRQVVTSLASAIGTGPDFGIFTRAITMGPNDGFLYALDRSNGAILKIDLSTGNRSVVSDNSVGTGVTISSLTDFVYDPTTGDFYVSDTGNNSIYRIAIDTGNRTDISISGLGSGTSLQAPTGINISADGQIIYVFDSSLSSLFGIDISSGNRTLISADANISTNSRLRLDKTKTNAYTISSSSDSISMVSIVGATHDFFYTASIGSGDAMVSPDGLFLNSSESKAYTVDPVMGRLHEIDIATGQKTIRKAGLSRPTSVFVNLADDLAYILDTDDDSIDSISLPGGIKTSVANSSLGSGLDFSFADSMAIAASGAKAYVIDADSDFLAEVDLSTGDRTTISNSSTGSGTMFGAPLGLVLNSSESLVYTADFNSDEVFEINLSSGDRRVISSSVIGTGVDFTQLTDITISNDDSTLYVAENTDDLVIAVDVSTGNRSIISGSGVGEGPQFGRVRSVFPSTDSNFIYVIDDWVDTLFKVDLRNGNRLAISK